MATGGGAGLSQVKIVNTFYGTVTNQPIYTCPANTYAEVTVLNYITGAGSGAITTSNLFWSVQHPVTLAWKDANSVLYYLNSGVGPNYLAGFALNGDPDFPAVPSIVDGPSARYARRLNYYSTFEYIPVATTLYVNDTFLLFSHERLVISQTSTGSVQGTFNLAVREYSA